MRCACYLIRSMESGTVSWKKEEQGVAAPLPGFITAHFGPKLSVHGISGAGQQVVQVFSQERKGLGPKY